MLCIKKKNRNDDYLKINEVVSILFLFIKLHRSK